MTEAPANNGAAQPSTASRIAAITPASGGTSANGAATCSKRDFLDPERDISGSSHRAIRANEDSQNCWARDQPEPRVAGQFDCISFRGRSTSDRGCLGLV